MNKNPFKPRITHKEVEEYRQVLSKILENKHDNSFAGNIEPNTLKLLDRLRNQLFLESILQDKQCLKSIAYDLDEVICNNNFNALNDVIDHLGSLNNKMECKHNIIKDVHDMSIKLDFYLYFKKSTDNFKDLNGWNSPAYKNIKHTEKINESDSNYYNSKLSNEVN
jgi:hypothetical protein